jgi:hypothetical protein
VADLTAPTFEVTPQGHQGRAQGQGDASAWAAPPNDGDAVVMSWFEGPRMLTDALDWMDRVEVGGRSSGGFRSSPASSARARQRPILETARAAGRKARGSLLSRMDATQATLRDPGRRPLLQEDARWTPNNCATCIRRSPHNFYPERADFTSRAPWARTSRPTS